MDVVAVIGLGYVGLPLAVAFGKLLPTIGYDLSASKLDAYRQHRDPSGTVSSEDLRTATQLEFTADPADLRRANILIIVGNELQRAAGQVQIAPHTGRDVAPQGAAVFDWYKD